MAAKPLPMSIDVNVTVSLAQTMLATPRTRSGQPPEGSRNSPVTKAAPSTTAVASFIRAGETRPEATARRGPTRSGVSAPCQKGSGAILKSVR